MRRAFAAGALACLVALGAAREGEAHHLGVYVPKDDEITASFKRMKVFLEHGRADLLRREFAQDRWVQRRMAEVDARYQATLVPDMQRALASGSIPDAEQTIVRFFCFVSREKVQEALDRLAMPALSARQKEAQGLKLLGAAWRYYNLVDFRVGKAAPPVSTAAKVVFEEGEFYLGASSKGRQAYDEAKAREALIKFRDLMTDFLDATGPAKAEARRP
ncbi:MAG TPA: hypothetical protein VIG69_15525 [Candidatus Methylomirabilis sp.]